jgi:SAM-dependent methyltransferase
MKIRDSGMPEETYWESLLDVRLILERFHVERFADVAELGCGYGTFSVPLSQAITGTLYTFDIDPEMVERTRIRGRGLPMVAEVRDVETQGFGVRVDAALLFNILHCERPVALLRQAAAALGDGGEVLVIHWRHDVPTPRGPEAAIRPSPDRIATWGREAGLEAGPPIELPPWHYGLRLVKRSD